MQSFLAAGEIPPGSFRPLFPRCYPPVDRALRLPRGRENEEDPDDEELSSAQTRTRRGWLLLAVGRGGSKVAAERPFCRIYCVSSFLSLSPSLSSAALPAAAAVAGRCRCRRRRCCWCCYPFGSRVSLLSEQSDLLMHEVVWCARVSSRVNFVSLTFAHRHAGYFPGTSAIFHAMPSERG